MENPFFSLFNSNKKMWKNTHKHRHFSQFNFNKKKKKENAGVMCVFVSSSTLTSTDFKFRTKLCGENHQCNNHSVKIVQVFVMFYIRAELSLRCIWGWMRDGGEVVSEVCWLQCGGFFFIWLVLFLVKGEECSRNVLFCEIGENWFKTENVQESAISW